MHIKFKHLKVHGFLSLGDVELDLDNQGYVLVKGFNENPKDNASSNGSGKSSLHNAIAWVLTGETVNGLKTNISNIYLNDGCFGTLSFSIDKDNYEITRYKDYGKIGTNLSIYINGENKSGKTYNESKSLLAQYLPDITPSLLCSTTLIGQGMPHKFTNNTPSGRKEVLEQLTKSDFMLQDIKDRVVRRTNEISNQKRQLEDEILRISTSISIYERDINKLSTELTDLESISTTKLSEEYLDKENEKTSLNNRISTLEQEQSILINAINKLNNDYQENVNKKKSLLESINNTYDDKLMALQENIITISSNIRQYNNSLMSLSKVKDTCPMCGQKLPNTHHNIEQEKKELQDKLGQEVNNLNKLKAEKQTLEAAQKSKQFEIERMYTFDTTELNKLNTSLQENYNILSNLAKKVRELENNQTSIKTKLDTLEQQKNSLLSNINDLKAALEKDSVNLMYNKEREAETVSHEEVLTKFNTLIKRDFRGFLLTNVIDFLNSTAKKYCQCVFNNEELTIELKGNNIDITFQGKSFDNLSGGEKQKIDLLIQFSIRDLMCQYLDFSSNILVLDEILDFLDDTGATTIINMIAEKLTDISSLYFITHHTELNFPYDSVIQIVKNEKGVSELR